MTSSSAPRITITAADIEAQRHDARNHTSSATIIILPGPGNSSKTSRILTHAILTSVPFVNVWIWLRLSKSCQGVRQRLFVVVAVLLAVISCVLVFGAGIYAVLPRQSWIETINQAADRGVLLVTTKSSDGQHTGFNVGAGFVVAVDNEHALVVTNKHVVGLSDSPRDPGRSNLAQCVLVLRSGTQIEGVVAGWHRSTNVDLALILAERGGLRPLGHVGHFERVKIGDDVLAIGHPEGVLMFSFSRGTVERKWEGAVLQTSVPISQGNSGGPLLDRHGRVIGVNTALFSPEVGSPKALSIRADLLLQPDQWKCCPDSRRLLGRVTAE